MNDVLNTREKNALRMIWNYQGEWEPLSKFSGKVGRKTIARFLELNLVDSRGDDVFGIVYHITKKGCEFFE